MDAPKPLNGPPDDGREHDDAAAGAPVRPAAAAVEWYIELFLGVHFADNLA